ncbi:MAG TPA: efflux RND transporter periplasmic adaptor subunit [Bryobacteraceae bacterium]|jgi:RND family efflux transporter MFP subunit|nr:efflux RND transporter periplasmic adaptor subunit [Bryobacteraceae bacterium]
MKKSWLLLILPVLLLAWWGFGRKSATPQVHFAQARKVTVESTVSTNGKAEPAEWAAARAEAAGIVETIKAERGQQVAAGQTLLVLDQAAVQSELAAAAARLQEAQAENATLGHGGRPATVANLDDAVNSAKTAVSVAQRNYETMQRLAKQQAATAQQVQDAHDALLRAQLQLQAAENQRTTLVTSSDKAVAQGKVNDAAAALALARHRLGASTVTAPISGILYQFDLKVGAYLQSGQQVGLVGNLDQMKVVVYVDEPDLGRVAVGMPVRITWDARPDEQWWGKVDRMPTQIVALGTRTVGEVTTLVDNPKRELLPGVSVNATIISKVVPDAISIPKAALRTLNGSNGVYKLEKDDKLAWTTVRTGISDVNNVQIDSGLGIGDYVADRVIEPSDAEIRNGMAVRPVRK